jgi:hypothetical protein
MIDVYLDMDGIIADWVGGIQPVLDELGVDTVEQANKLSTSFSSAICKFYEANPSFFADLDYINEFTPVFRMIDNLRTNGVVGNVVFLTAAGVGDMDDTIPGKRKFLERVFAEHLSDLHIPPMIVTAHSKGLYAHKNAVLVDDFNRNTKQFSAAGGHGYYLKRGYNGSTVSRDIRWFIVDLHSSGGKL